ncbi:MAG TPA: DUF6572 domain-containing protein [Chthoniobacteraceae bacterium]|jgi:hypothetical protein|nr:DUF6572 domain-containing protein [Chthoniobacteraceae bacterium]
MSEDSCCQGGSCHSESGAKATNGVANPAVLDALAEDKVTGEVVLVMFEDRSWDLGDQQLFQLQEKLNAYLSFALDGELAEQLPQFANRPVRVQLNCSEPPPEPVVAFLSKVREQVGLQGINFVVEGIAPPESGGCGEGCGCH